LKFLITANSSIHPPLDDIKILSVVSKCPSMAEDQQEPLTGGVRCEACDAISALPQWPVNLPVKTG
jgi:hypothetical protein